MRYDDRIIDQVQSANDIVELISQYIPLKRAGRNLKAVCPFHQEKTPSFMVNPEKQIFHCFGCSAGGNVFSFLMRCENISFPEALRQLAERAHIALPKSEGEKKQSSTETEQLYEVYRRAAEFYHAKFMHPEIGRAARAYFEKRGYTAKTAEELKIGWAPEAWRELFESLSKKGFSNQLLLRSALVQQSPKGPFYDTFRARLLFPIQNLQGKIVAFGGRILKEGEPGPKYLNSPENPIFQKRRELFGLYLAKKFIDRERPRLIVVEGYFDFLRLYQDRFKAAVATLGTALGEDHVQILKRFADEAIVVYDGDKAGEAASLRGLEVFLEGGMNVRLAMLPEGFDPDDYLEKKGADAFQKILDEARDLFDFKLEVLMRRHPRSDSLGLLRITQEFMETFSKIKSPVLLDRYLRRLASALAVDEGSLRSELAALKKKRGAREDSRGAEKKSAPQKSDLSDEIILLALMVESPEKFQGAFSELQAADFQHGVSRQLFQLLQGHGPGLAWSQILNRIEDEDYKQRLVSASAVEWDDEGRTKAFDDCVKRLKKKPLERRLLELRQNIAKAEREGDPGRLGAYMKEYQTLWHQIR